MQDAEERAAKEQEKMAAAYEKELAAEKCVPYSVDCWKVVLVADRWHDRSHKKPRAYVATC